MTGARGRVLNSLPMLFPTGYQGNRIDPRQRVIHSGYVFNDFREIGG
jgi:hypothetical protein